MPFTMSAIDVGLVHAMGAEGYGKATCFHFFDHSHGYVAARSDRLKFRNVGNSSGAPLRDWPMSRLTQWAGSGLTALQRSSCSKLQKQPFVRAAAFRQRQLSNSPRRVRAGEVNERGQYSASRASYPLALTDEVWLYREVKA